MSYVSTASICIFATSCRSDHENIRQYISKGGDFTEITDADIIAIQNKLNSHPRKSLNMQHPTKYFLSCR